MIKKPGFYDDFGGVTEVISKNPVSESPETTPLTKKPGFYDDFGGVAEMV